MNDTRRAMALAWLKESGVEHPVLLPSHRLHQLYLAWGEGLLSAYEASRLRERWDDLWADHARRDYEFILDSSLKRPYPVNHSASSAAGGDV